MVGKQSLPEIDYLYLDMNGIIYKCVKVNFYMISGWFSDIQVANYAKIIRGNLGWSV